MILLTAANSILKFRRRGVLLFGLHQVVRCGSAYNFIFGAHDCSCEATGPDRSRVRRGVSL
jgi:hypothetical protein